MSGRRSLALIRPAGLACICLALTAALAQAGTGGVSTPPEPSPDATSFGDRVLRLGMSGEDVRVLNALVRSKPYAGDIRLTRTFGRPTRTGVSLFQERHGLRATGIVNRTTAEELVRTMRRAQATWYGPGLYGNTTACGQRLRRGTVGVAHRTLPCGTVVAVGHRGRFLVTKVIDRGPYHPGYTWDLTNAAARLLGFEGTGQIRVAVAR